LGFDPTYKATNESTVTEQNLLNIRNDFPIFQRKIDGKEIVYLDSASTAQKPECVIKAIDDFYRRHNANIHRGVYLLSEEATELFEGARKRIAAYMSADSSTTVFTRNVTEAINLVAYSWGRSNIEPGDVVLITEMEHHSNIVPWQILCQERSAELRYVKVTDDGTLDKDQLDAELSSGCIKLLSLTHVSNVLGTVNDVKSIVSQAREAGATTLVDGAQAAPQLPVSVKDIDADFYVWTGHKMFGPTGIGVLHGRRSTLEQMPPFLGGGDMIKKVDFQSSTWNDLPWKFEAGTSMIAEAIGLGEAIDYLTSLGIENVRSHEQDLTEYALSALAEIPGLTSFGPKRAADRGGLVSFKLEGIHPHDVAELTNRSNVCIRAGHHCAQPLMRRLKVPATTRASFGPYNTRSDIDALTTALKEARNLFKL